MHTCAYAYFTSDVLACNCGVTERTLASVLVVCAKLCAKLVCTSAGSISSAFPVTVVGVLEWIDSSPEGPELRSFNQLGVCMSESHL